MKEAIEAAKEGALHMTPTERLKFNLETFKSEDEHCMNERAQLLTALACPEALTEDMMTEVRERSECLFCGLIDIRRVDR